jgi:hypothetical protein
MRDLLTKPEFLGSLDTFIANIKSILTGNLTYLPAIVIPISIWFGIGIATYFVLYSLRMVYSDLAERFYQGFFYTNKKPDLEREVQTTLTRTKRLLIHLAILISYLVLIVGTFLLVPVSNTIRLLVEEFFLVYISSTGLSFALGIVASFIFWLMVMSAVYSLYYLLMRAQKSEEIAEEHF